MRRDWVKSRTGNVTQMHYARQGVITEEMRHVAGVEYLAPEFVL
jgi:phosphomethylpyrimidine synthase